MRDKARPSQAPRALAPTLVFLAAHLALIPALGAQVLRGTVVADPLGHGVAGVAVALLDAHGKTLDSIGATTDSAGRFALYVRDDGTYSLAITTDNSPLKTSQPIKLKEEEMATFHIILALAVGGIDLWDQRKLTDSELDGRLGFEYRRMHGIGRFLTQTDIAHLPSLDGLTSLPAFRDLVPPPSGGFMRLGQCAAPNIVLVLDGKVIERQLVDGHLVADWERLKGGAVIPSIAAIEVFTSGQFSRSPQGSFDDLPRRAAGWTLDRANRMIPIGGRGSGLCVIRVSTRAYFNAIDLASSF